MKGTVDSKIPSSFLTIILFKVILFFFLFCAVSHADVLTLAWDPPSQEPELVYTLCYGTSSQSYPTCIDAGNQTSATVDNIEPGIPYYYAVTASNQYGESDFSQEIEHTIPLSTNDSDNDGDGKTEAQGDCDDSDPTVNPDADEICGDGIDQNCDGNDLVCSADPEDIDGDNDGFTENQGDCDDSDPTVNPSADEICGDGTDQNCDGNDLVCPEDPEDIDDDNDGFTENQGDCDDSDPTINPGADEICGDGIDQDCNGSDLTCVDVNVDTDGDGLSDTDEISIYGTNPNKADSDGDGVDDGTEINSGSNPLISDNNNTGYGGLEILNLSAVSGNYYEVISSGAQIGDLVYIDRKYTIQGLPVSLENAIYVQTANNDKQSDGNDFLSFLTTKDVVVYLAHDYRIDPKPDWMADFSSSGTQVITSDTRFDVYYKYYPAGTITLGGNYGTSANSMYTLFIAEDNSNNTSLSDSDKDGFTENEGDCNDSDANVHPGAFEKCSDGIDQDCSGADLVCPDDNELIKQAEDGVISGAFEIVEDSSASGGYYVHVPNRTGTRYDGPDSTHKIIYTFNVPATGTYKIKGAVYAARGSDDSFWVQVNDSPADGYLWDVVRNTSFQTDYVNDRDGADPVEVSLSAGFNTVSVYLREDGTRLDTIELEPVAIISSDIDDDEDGYLEAQGDCDDTDPSINPGAIEICGDGKDQDCDGSDLDCLDVNIDTDEDGLADFEELNTYNTDPNKADTDGDGYSDGEEILKGSDPLLIESSPDSALPNIEAGEVSVDHNWSFVSFSGDYTDPVVIAGAASLNGSQPTTVRLRNVTNKGFEIRLQEWEYLDGTHVKESVGYLVMESGQYRLNDGTLIEAGSFNTKTPATFERVNFQRSFNRQPVVFATISSVNDPDTIVTRLRNVDSSGFDLKLQEQEANAGDHQAEVISYLAWEPSAGIIDRFIFQVGLTADEVTHNLHTIGFNFDFDHLPVFLCDMQTTDGGDTANLRWQNKDELAVDVLVDEEQSNDEEVNHITEVVGFIGIVDSAK
jgi:hypothetical protein